MNVTDWCIILNFLGTEKTKKEISDTLKQSCLATPPKVYGVYCVDDEKAWNKLIVAEKECYEAAKKLRMECSADVEPWYFELRSRQMWRSYRTTWRKKKR